MADIFSPSKRSDVMRRIRSKDTKPERHVRGVLHSRGFRYRLHRKDLPGNPDLVLSKYRTVIFVHGCFWHGHPCKIGSGNRKPKTHLEYWNRKIEGNVRRDKDNHARLAKMGWKIIVLWECETQTSDGLLLGLKPLLEMKRNGE